MSVTKEVKAIVSKNFFFEFGLQNRIVNLSQLARLIKPLVQERLSKKVEVNSITMALSRIQNQLTKKAIPNKLIVEDVSLKNNLCSMTFYKTSESQKQISLFQEYCLVNNKFFTRADSNREIGINFHNNELKEIKNIIIVEPKAYKDNIGAVMVSIPKEYLHLKGVFQYFIQRLTMQNINILEMGSTYTELIFYMDEKDLALAANTFLNLQA